MEVVGHSVVEGVHAELEGDVRDLHPPRPMHREEVRLVRDVLCDQGVVGAQAGPGPAHGPRKRCVVEV